MLNRQTYSSGLQSVTSKQAAHLLSCDLQQLRYAAWPQELLVPSLGDGGSAGLETVVVTGEAWIKSPNPDGSISRGCGPLPALVFVAGRAMGVAADFEDMEGLINPTSCAWLIRPESDQSQELKQSALEIA